MGEKLEALLMSIGESMFLQKKERSEVYRHHSQLLVHQKRLIAIEKDLQEQYKELLRLMKDEKRSN